MKKALIVAGAALVLTPAVLAAGYLGVQAYIDWLIAGAKRPLTGIRRASPSAAGGASPSPRAPDA
jgi:hypothetical protein